MSLLTDCIFDGCDFIQTLFVFELGQLELDIVFFAKLFPPTTFAFEQIWNSWRFHTFIFQTYIVYNNNLIDQNIYARFKKLKNKLFVLRLLQKLKWKIDTFERVKPRTNHVAQILQRLVESDICERVSRV